MINPNKELFVWGPIDGIKKIIYLESFLFEPCFLEQMGGFYDGR